MAQEEYFLALARMFQQGQAEANQNALALSQMMKADKRYEADVARDDKRYAEGAPLREAQLQSMLAGVDATKAGTEATQVNTGIAKDTSAFSVEKARLGAEQMREALTQAKNANDPRMVEAEIERTLADSLFSQYRAQSAKAQKEIDTDPAVMEAKKQSTIISQAAAMTELRKGDAALDEFLSGASARTAIRDADVSKAKYDVANQLDPAQLEEVKRLGVTSKRVENALNEAQVDSVKGANFGNSLINLKRALDIRDSSPLPPYLNGAVETFAATKAAALGRDASPEAVRQYGQSVSQFVSALHSVGRKDPEMALAMTRAVAQATKMVSVDLSSSGKTGDVNAALSAQSVLLDRVTDSVTAAGLSPGANESQDALRTRFNQLGAAADEQTRRDASSRYGRPAGNSPNQKTRSLEDVFRPKFGQPK